MILPSEGILENELPNDKNDGDINENLANEDELSLYSQEMPNTGDNSMSEEYLKIDQMKPHDIKSKPKVTISKESKYKLPVN